MKTSKVIVGALSAAMLSLSVCSALPVVAAGETVQVSVGTAKVEAGQEFSVDVSFSGVPSTGIQSCEFAVKYDPSLITISSVKEGAATSTGASSADPSASMIANFGSNIDSENGCVAFMWSTSLDDSSYWINSDGVFCTLSGKVSDNASGSIPIEVIPISRETKPESKTDNDALEFGYSDASGKVISYATSAVNGAVVVGTPDTTTDKDVLKGDANVDGNVDIADAVLILQSLANPDVYTLTEQGKANADVVGNDGVTAADALEIQMYEAGHETALGKK